MKPISPVLPSSPEIPETVLAKDQPQYQPLPVAMVQRDAGAACLSRWILDPVERWQVLLTGEIWLEQLTFGHPLQPQLPTAFEPGTDFKQYYLTEAHERALEWLSAVLSAAMRRSYPPKHLTDFAAEVHAVAERNGFHPEGQELDTFLPRAVSNLHGEVSELHEAWRTNQLFGPCDKAEKMKAAGLRPLTCAEEELADIILRALDNAHQLGVDIAEAVRIKHAFNCTWEYQHGGKKS